MKRSKTVTVGELLDEFFQRPYVAAKVAEGRLRDTWREIVGPAADAETTELRLENPTGQCSHHPVRFIFFLRGGSTILGRYWHYSKKKCIFAR